MCAIVSQLCALHLLAFAILCVQMGEGGVVYVYACMCMPASMERGSE